ncbi:MAG: glycoside hydrolase family 13 protein [Clostridia bacterium]|nr:glycoside hydrolase family 13 protein [Clostridia bacterium]
MRELIYFDSKNPHCKYPFGSVAQGKETTFRIFVKDGVFVQSVELHVYADGADTPYVFHMSFVCKRGDESEFFTKINLNKVGLYWYKFIFKTEEGIYEYAKEDGDFQFTVYNKNFVTPDWIKGGIIYHIFVDRFCKGEDKDAVFKKQGVLKEWGEDVTIVDDDGVFRANDFYGGNFQGIIDKLPYLKRLGVTLLYLSPIFKSSSNHRYDTGDYELIDELLGTESKFKELIDKAEKAGIRVMLDGVFNHTGADSKYFNKFGNYPEVGAYQSKQSPYYEWFDFYNYPDEYHCWWGITVTPTVSQRAKSFRNMISGEKGIIDKWTKLGVKGWRLDVVDELREDFVEDIRKAVKRNGEENLIIGEVWEDASNKIAYSYRRHYFQGKQLDGVMNYPFKEAVLSYALGGNAAEFAETVMTIVENYPKQCLDATMNLIDSHDTARALSVLSGVDMNGTDKQYRKNFRLSKEGYDFAKKRLIMASTLQFMLPGVPSIFYGDEQGMEGYEDPLCRRCLDWDNIDSELLAHYIQLGKIRKKFKDQVCGDTYFEHQNNLLVLCRRSGNKTLKVVANNTNQTQSFYCPKAKEELLSGQKLQGASFEILVGEVGIFLV